MRKHLEWSLNRTFGDLMKESMSKGTEDASRMTAILGQLFGSISREYQGSSLSN